jgi:S-adenosylmethionine-diacylglycerol 3-amino-3-carboxypropyl transferase
MGSEIAAKADFAGVRYAQVWEDADVLVEALDVRADDVVLSIASAGDNALALLSRGPARVIALDLSPAQLACLELRVAAYRELEHGELLELIGSIPSDRRLELYRRCRVRLCGFARDFWDARPKDIAAGIGGAGKFERYFALFRTRVLPLVHRRGRVLRLMHSRSLTERRLFYDTGWNTWRWRMMFKVFFSRFVMGRRGRDPSFFRYVEGSVADRILARTKYALTELDPAANPYLQWILTGRHLTALPFALRPENFDAIRRNLDRLEWRCQSVEDYVDESSEPVSKANLSDIFEYMSAENCERLLGKLVARSRPGGRLAYWNMLVPRSRPEALADKLRPRPDLAERLFRQDQAFFYSRFVVEEVLG